MNRSRLSLRLVFALLCLGASIVCRAEIGAAAVSAMKTRIEERIARVDARVGVAVIFDGSDTLTVNGCEAFPMLSVYKFPQALAVADYCRRTGLGLSDTIAISADEMKINTWSPLREKYGVNDLRLPLAELLEYSLSRSDNNACDILFRLTGGVGVADSLISSIGFPEIRIVSTEDEMHRDLSLCYRNSSTPLEMARLFDRFYRLGMCDADPVSRRIASIMLDCATGLQRLPSPLEAAGAGIGHKTGTGDVSAEGRIIAVNDAGCVFLPDGRAYSIAVFVADSAYDMATTERIIADISAIVLSETLGRRQK